MAIRLVAADPVKQAVVKQPVVKQDPVKQASVKQREPVDKPSIRSSVEAFRAYHRESMRRRRAAAKAALDEALKAQIGGKSVE